jgi:hypothetical protein
MDCQFWFIVHVYIVDGWKCILILLILEQVVNDVTIDNCTKVIVGNMFQFGGFSKFKFASKFISFGVHGILFF